MTEPAGRGGPRRTGRGLQLTLRRRRTQAPRLLRRARGAGADATLEPDPGPRPEVVFDRVTGPYAHRRAAAVAAPGLGAYDEET